MEGCGDVAQVPTFGKCFSQNVIPSGPQTVMLRLSFMTSFKCFHSSSFHSLLVSGMLVNQETKVPGFVVY